MRNRKSRNPFAAHSRRYMQERQARFHAKRDPLVDALYSSGAWRELRAIVKRDAGGRCQWPGCQCDGVAVDHKQPHKGDRGLFFARANLWLLCKLHHDRKTIRNDGGFGRPIVPLESPANVWPSVGPLSRVPVTEK